MRARIAGRTGAFVASLLASIALAGAAVIAPPAGLSDDDAQGYAIDAITSGSVNWWPARELWLRSAPAARVALVDHTLRWAKAFALSPAFAAAYAQRRDESKPTPPEAKGTVDAELAAQRAEQRKQIADMRASLAQMPAEVRGQMKQVIDEQEKAIAQQQKDPQWQQMMRQGIEAQRAEAQQQYQKSMADWNAGWPADPKRLIAQRLREFLAACADVQWNAKLAFVPEFNKKRFVDPALEQKPGEWKLCFRAGQQPVEAARAFATAWLRELPK